ncbi:MAG: phage portal protein, partial [Deltaproteobacteria bacterium]|nr:phage portal protein [Deltaproteobacteria bacterium]
MNLSKPISRAVAKVIPDAVILRAMEKALVQKQGASEGEGKWFTLLSHMSDYTALGSVYKQLASYQGHVYKVVNLISNRLSTLDFWLEYERGTESAVIDNHVFYDLARKPNPIWNFRQLLKFTDMHLELTGRAFWRKIRGPGNQVVELWPIVPSNFNELKTEKGEGGPTISAYVFFVGGVGGVGGAVKEVTIPAEDIVDFRFPHPTLMLEGASPIQAAAYAYDTDLAMRVYERRFFHNSARPDILLSSEQVINEDDATRIVKLWNQKFQGPEKKYSEPAVLGKGMSVEILSVSNKDLEFMVLKEWTKEDIFETYGVPPSMLGTIKEYRRDNMFASEMIFAKECLTPRSLLIGET